MKNFHLNRTLHYCFYPHLKSQKRTPENHLGVEMKFENGCKNILKLKLKTTTDFFSVQTFNINAKPFYFASPINNVGMIYV